MWLSLFLLVFLAAATYILAIQGLTSAAIMCALTVLSVAVSFATYEYVAQQLFMSLQPEYAYAAALFLTFLVPLAATRLTLDVVIPRANLLPHLLDRLSGAGVGFLAAFLVTGMLALCVQLLPWGSSIMGFQRFNMANPEVQNELWLRPDRAVAGFAASMSGGVFAGGESLADSYPDLVTAIGCTSTLPRGSRRVLPSGAISIVDTGRLDYLYDLQAGRRSTDPETQTPLDPRDGHFFVRVVLEVDSDGKDVDNRYRFSPSCVRLVGRKAKAKDEAMVVIPATGVIDDVNPNRFIGKWQKRGEDKSTSVSGRVFSAGKDRQVAVAFEIPDGFEPAFISYKLGARTKITKQQLAIPAGGVSSIPSAPPAAGAPPPPPANRAARGGRVVARFAGSRFGDSMPVKMTDYLARDEELRNGVLEQGQLAGPLDKQDSGSGTPVDRFAVPQGKRLLQLNVASLQSKSLPGRVLDFSVSTVQNYVLEDDQGNRHTPVGKCAVANVGGAPYYEVQYFPEYVTSGAKLPSFTKIRRQHLKGEYQLIYLFLLDPGARATRFTYGGIKGPVDLSGLNLVAR